LETMRHGFCSKTFECAIAKRAAMTRQGADRTWYLDD
jgi:hypothetical protein